MKKRILPAITLAISALIPAAHADSLLIGAKGGLQALEFEELLGRTDSSPMAAVQMGYAFSKSFAMELEVSSSLDKGEVLQRDFNLQNTALYLSLRGQDARYYIGKVGAVQTEVDFVDSANMDDTGTAVTFGIGFGKTVALEFELSAYSYKEMGNSVMISGGLRF